MYRHTVSTYGRGSCAGARKPHTRHTKNAALEREEGKILVEVEVASRRKEWLKFHHYSLIIISYSFDQGSPNYKPHSANLKCGAFREPALVRVFRVSRRRFSCLRRVTTTRSGESEEASRRDEVSSRNRLSTIQSRLRDSSPSQISWSRVSAN